MTTFVLLPGLDGTGRLFDSLIKFLPKGDKAVVISYPAHRVMNLASLEEHVRKGLPKGEPFVLVAESFGGLLAARIAARPPRTMRALVLSASFVTSPVRRPLLALKKFMGPHLFKRRPPRAFMRCLLAGHPCGAAQMKMLEDVILSVNPEVLWNRLVTVSQTDESQRLKKSQIPLLYLRATKDRLVQPGCLDDIRRLRPDVQVVDIDAPHFLLQLAPKAAMDAVSAFLKGGKRILIATATAGGGHLAAAAALEEAWRKLYPQDAIKRVDILDFTPRLYRKAYAEGYVKLAEKTPELYAHAFRQSDDSALIKKLTPFRRLSARLVTGGFLKLVDDFKPDVVLCPHFLPMEALGATRGKTGHHQPKVVTVVTDFEAHALWMEPGVDLYCVAAPETKARLVARGIHENQIAVTGIPVSQRFLKPVKKDAILGRYKLTAMKPTLLVLGGGMGMGPLAETVRALDHAHARFQMMVVAGRNKRLKERLQKASYHHRVEVLGFAGNMEELMAASDLIITKPGGLTSSEALAIGKPLLIVNPLPGQEAANSDYLLERGAAVKANRLEDLAYRIESLLSSNHLARMGKAAKAIGRPRAAETIGRLARRMLHGA